MNIIIFAHSDSSPYQRLNHAIASLDLVQALEVYGQLNHFCQRFRTIAHHPDIIIIMPDGSEELDRLIDHRELFENTRTIVILPQREEPLLSKGHKLRPSFITYCDDDFGEIIAVLQHVYMNQAHCHPPQAPSANPLEA
ncbi:hypothetical protein DSCO28_25390 [Desulfosarcina ovata subsp. sediminis]|uniref:Response regulatory domain-containing protein n=1 Tax=Desulfosarcina ovata subsp. sediminis TaxID=885957 RepID=A0A5K7ZRK8_9BACT|nr:hypothetical protein [Desulfosarcina ovata]BBO81973.1 hypothetical protein DSCO28_25390 [Desulfosarcina ovata subsp. sediminis]